MKCLLPAAGSIQYIITYIYIYNPCPSDIFRKYKRNVTPKICMFGSKT